MQNELLELNNEIVRELFIREAARRDLLFFAQYIDHEYQAPLHIKAIAEKLQAVASGGIKRLMIHMPPRHGKSLLTSKLFPAWILGNRPKAQIILTSYAATLSYEFSRWIRETIRSPFFHDLFNTQLKEDSQAIDRWETNDGGALVAAGVGGPVTGRGADLIIIDDPHKNYEDALSVTMQEKAYDWYISTLRTRLNPNGSIVMVCTRWSEDDLAGRVIQHEPDKWTVVSLPAIDKDGCALWQERYNIDELREIRQSVTEKIWGALYQQQPIDITERIFTDPKYCKFPEDLPLIGYLDPAFGGEDYSALTIGSIDRLTGNIYIKAGHCWKSQIDETYNRTEYYCKGYNVRTLYVETNAAQITVGYELQRRSIVMKAVTQLKNKHFRIVHFGKRNWNRIYFNEDMLGNKETLQYIDQLLRYSEQAQHDDVPDSFAGLIQALTLRRKALIGGSPLSIK